MLPDIIISNLTSLEDSEVQKCIAAIQRQIAIDFAPIWGVSAVLHFGGKVAPADKQWGISITDQNSMQYLGEHHLENVPRGVVLLGACKADGADWRTTLSHEVLELLGDPPACINVELPDGTEEAFEASDAVEGNTYDVDGQPMSNFVVPLAYFMEQGTKYDFLGKLSRPHTLTPGGYRIIRQPGEPWTQEMGQVARKSKLVPSRWSRRGRRIFRRMKVLGFNV